MEMNNEPVAWMVEGYDGIGSYVRTVVSSKPKPDSWVNIIPLYTHPAKTLTDEEIKDLWCEVYDFKRYDCLTELDYKFCREIIKKAQEK
jgi:hypothetical protein